MKKVFNFTTNKNPEPELKTLDEYLKECPVWVVEKAVPFLKELLGKEGAEETKRMWKEDPEFWWAGFHHGWGTSVRNRLRKDVCKDNELPSGNWDDYYIQLVELACEVR